jgi:hypothetical protein
MAQSYLACLILQLLLRICISRRRATSRFATKICHLATSGARGEGTSRSLLSALNSCPKQPLSGRTDLLAPNDGSGSRYPLLPLGHLAFYSVDAWLNEGRWSRSPVLPSLFQYPDVDCLHAAVWQPLVTRATVRSTASVQGVPTFNMASRAPS